MPRIASKPPILPGDRRMRGDCPEEARNALPDQLDRKGTQATMRRIVEALAAGEIGARRAAALRYGIEMCSGPVP